MSLLQFQGVIVEDFRLNFTSSLRDHHHFTWYWYAAENKNQQIYSDEEAWYVLTDDENATNNDEDVTGFGMLQTIAPVYSMICGFL